jgi:type II secretory pathway component PulC
MIVLGFAMAAGGFAYLSHRSKGAKLVAPPPGAEVSAYKVEVESMTAPPAVEEEAVAVAEKPLPTLKLGGILFSSDEGASMALINGKVVREGATIEGARLVKVSTEKVELEFEGRKISIRAL